MADVHYKASGTPIAISRKEVPAVVPWQTKASDTMVDAEE